MFLFSFGVVSYFPLTHSHGHPLGLVLLPFRFSVSGCFLWCFPFPLLHGVQPRLSLPYSLSAVALFGPCAVRAFCGVWCLLLSSFPFQGSISLHWPFRSVLLLPLSLGACWSFSFGLSSFGSKVSLSDGIACWDESMVLPCISPAFCFEGLVLFLCLRLAWFSSFFCGRLFSIFLHSFRLVRLFSFFSGHLSGSLSSPFLLVLSWAGVSCL